jgi:hypothetical protein
MGALIESHEVELSEVWLQSMQKAGLCSSEEVETFRPLALPLLRALPLFFQGVRRLDCVSIACFFFNLRFSPETCHTLPIELVTLIPERERR